MASGILDVASRGLWGPELRVVELGICDAWRGFGRGVEKDHTCPYRILYPDQGMMQTAEVRDGMDPAVSLDISSEWSVFA